MHRYAYRRGFLEDGRYAYRPSVPFRSIALPSGIPICRDVSTYAIIETFWSVTSPTCKKAGRIGCTAPGRFDEEWNAGGRKSCDARRFGGKPVGSPRNIGLGGTCPAHPACDLSAVGETRTRGDYRGCHCRNRRRSSQHVVLSPRHPRPGGTPAQLTRGANDHLPFGCQGNAVVDRLPHRRLLQRPSGTMRHSERGRPVVRLRHAPEENSSEEAVRISANPKDCPKEDVVELRRIHAPCHRLAPNACRRLYPPYRRTRNAYPWLQRFAGVR